MDKLNNNKYITDISIKIIYYNYHRKHLEIHKYLQKHK